MLKGKQQRFVDEYLIDLNATQAAIRAGYSEKTAKSIGQENLTKPDIAQAIKDYQLKAQKRAETTLDDILNELDENRQAALTAETVQSSAATAATMAKAKLLGFVVEKQSVKHEGLIEVDIAPKLSKEDWMKAHGLVATAGHTK